VEFSVLGRLKVVQDGRELRLGGARERSVLALLVLEAGRVVPVASLVDRLWPDEPPRTAVHAVHVSVCRLRGVLGGERIETRRPGYVLRAAPGHVDLAIFEDLCRRGRAAAADGDPATASTSFARALALWRGRALDDLQDEQFAGPLTARLDEARRTAVEERAAADLALGRHVEVVRELEQLVAAAPLRERPRALLMRALHGCGRRAEALAIYADARRMLVDELGIEPGPDLRDAQAAVLAGDSSAEAEGSTATVAADPVTVPAQLPADVPGFAGRRALLAHLGVLLKRAAGPRVSVLSGTAGVGKTTLAVHFGHRVRDRFPDGQLYVDLRGFDPGGRAVGAGEALHGFLVALGVAPDRIPSDLGVRAALYRSLLNDRHVLVVLDNARDIAHIRPLLPGARTTFTLVTSRDPLAGLISASGADARVLDMLTDAEAHELLAGRLGAGRLAAEPAAVSAIIAACARLPLALGIAAARAVTLPGHPLAALASELTAPAAALDALDTGDPAGAVRPVFACSYDAISLPAARLFRLLGLHPGPDVSAPAAASLAGVPQATVRPLLVALTRAGLLIERAPGRYGLHDLLRAYAADLAAAGESDRDRHDALRRLLDHYLRAAYVADRRLNPYRDRLDLPALAADVTPEGPADQDGAMAWLTAEHEVLLGAVAAAARAGFDEHTWQLAFALATFQRRRGHWQAAATVGLAALAAADRIADPAAQVYAHRLVARAACLLGDVGGADAHYRSALDLSARAGDAVGEGHTWMELGMARERAGDPAGALESARRALARYRAANYTPGHAAALNAVGWCHAQLGNHRLALDDCSRALPLLQQLGDRAAEAATWDSLGSIHHRLAAHTAAIRCHRNALRLFQDLGDREEEAGTLVNLGTAARAAGDTEAAGRAWRQALTIRAELDPAGAHTLRERLADLERAPA
jgi:DNA-binding SARP family transcriptional activator